MANAGSIRAGKAQVELGIDDRITAGLKQIEKRFLTWAKGLVKIGAGVAGAGGGLFAPLFAAFTDAVKHGANIQTLANKFNATSESISTLQGAFAQAGVEGSEFEGILEGLATKISHAADMNEKLVEVTSGFRGRDLLGKGVSTQLEMILDDLAKIPDAQDRIRAANELGLGSLLPIIQKGSAGLREMRDAAIANGDALDPQTAKQSLEVMKEYNRVSLSVRTTILAVGKALIPTGASFSSFGADIRSTLADARAWIQEHRGIIIGAAAIGAGLLTAGTLAITFASGLALAGAAAGGLATILGVISTPIGLVVGGVALLGGGLLLLASRTEKGKEALTGLLDAAKFVGGGLADALSVGDFSLAWRIGLATMNVGWRGFLHGLQSGWTDFKSFFVDGWHEAILGIQIAWNSVDRWFTDMTLRLAQTLADNFGGAVSKMLKAAAAALDKADLLGIFKEEIEDLRMIGNAFGTSGFGSVLADERSKSKKEHDAAANKLLKDSFDDQLSRNTARHGGLQQSEGALRDAIVELMKLRAEAAAGAKGQGFGGFAEGIGAGIAASLRGAGGAAIGPALSAISKGAFAGPIQQQLGYGDTIGKRQLDAAIDTAKNTAPLPQMGKDLNAVVGQLKFK